MGWRVANFLAIAAPYLLAAVFFTVLFLQPTTPPAHAAFAPPLNPASDNGSSAGTPVPAAPAHSAPPVPSQSAAPPSSTQAEAPAKSAGLPAAAPAALKEEPLPTGPVSVDPDVAETMKLPSDTLDYPAAAKIAHIQGVVVLAATIGADGGVQSVQPISGPALLEAGALGAVRSWRYRPWLVQGKPVSFTTQITINFEIGGTPQ